MAVNVVKRIDEAYREDQRAAVSVYEVIGGPTDRKGPVYWIHPEDEFRALAQRWLEETRYSSMLRDIVRHEAYQGIIEMGWAAVPLILAELAKPDPAPWGPALQAITRAQPVPDESVGRAELIAAAWLEWASELGYRHA